MNLSSREIAEEWHKGQMYGDRQYITHIEDVSNKVLSMYSTNEHFTLLIHTAYLHDLFEDTDCTEQEVRERMGEYGQIDTLIEALHAITKQENESREDYLTRCSQNPISLKVKIADSMANLESSFRTGESRRINKYIKQLDQLHKFQSVFNG
ncbi:hypothetical protein NTE19_003333 [Vibrio fluvialis]|nr:hypothetical protein [Vibrio fluvialis]